jgi:excisionase family DNA binding protein
MSTDKVTEHDDKLLWTINYIAEQLAVDRKTISRLIAKGELPVVQIGRSKRVPKQAVLDWVESQTRYNLGCVESVQSSQGESTCDSINVAGFTTLRTNRQLENRLENLLTPMTNK